MISCPSTVRIATENDADALLTFVCGADEEFFVRRSIDKIMTVIQQAVTRRRNPIFGVVKRNDEIEAAIGLSFSEPWASDVVVLSSFFFYVRPDKRRSGHASDLVDFGAWFGQSVGMPFILTEWSRGESGRARLFRRRAGAPIGTMFAIGAQAA